MELRGLLGRPGLILLLDMKPQESTISSRARRTKKTQWLQRALLFRDYLAGKRIMALKDTEVPGSNPDSDWGRSCPGAVPGPDRRTSRNKSLETALENCGYPFCFTVGENEAASRSVAHVALDPEGQFGEVGREFGGLIEQ